MAAYRALDSGGGQGGAAHASTTKHGGRAALILIAAGVAVPGLPTWLATVLVIGTWINPTLFLPLAFDPRAATRWWYTTVSVMSFTATSGGLVGVAVVGLSR